MRETTQEPLRYDPLSEGHRADPGNVFARLRAECPVHHARDRDLWVLSCHADVLAAARDVRAFSNETPPSGQCELVPEATALLETSVAQVDTLLTLHPPDHAENRRIVNEAFKPSRVAVLEGVIRAIARELVDVFDTDSAVEFMDAFSVPLPMRIISRMLGIPEAKFPSFKQWSDDIAMGLSAELSPEEQVVAHGRVWRSSAT